MLGAVVAAPALAEGYSWTTVDDTLVPAKNDVAISYDTDHTISLNGTTEATISGDIKLISTGDTALETAMGTADSLYISDGRLQVTDASKLGSSPIFIKGGQLWYKGGNLSNDVYIGTSTFGGGENGDKAAIRIQSGSTFSGSITVGEDARLNVTSATATFSGNINAENKTLSLTAFYGDGTMNLNGENTIGTLNLAETKIGLWESNLTVNINGTTATNALSVGAATNAVLNIKSGASLTTESITLGNNGRINIEKNGSLTYNNAGKGDLLDFSNMSAVSGGKLAFKNLSTSASGTVVKVSNDFAGNLVVLGGKLNANNENKQLGNAVIRLNGGGLTFTNGKSAENNILSNNIELVADTTDIQVWGSTHNAKITGSVSGEGKTLTKSDGGTVTLTGETTLGAVNVKGGILTLAGATTLNSATTSGGKLKFIGTTEKTVGTISGHVIAGGNFGVTSADEQTIQLTWDNSGNNGIITSGKFVVDDIDMSVDNTASGSVTLKGGVQMKVTDGTIWYSTKGSSLLLEEGAEVINNGFSIKGTTNVGVITTNGTPASQGHVASFMGTNIMQVANADITYTDVAATSINAAMKDSKLTVAEGAGQVTIATAAELSGLETHGALAVNANTTVSGTASIAGALSVANGVTLSLQKADTTIGTVTLNGGTITIGTHSGELVDVAKLTTSNLTVTADSTINADLVLAENSSLNMSAVVTMGCAVTIGTGTKLTADTSLTDAPVVLFSDVESLTLGTTEITKMGWYDANGILASVNGTAVTGEGQYVIGFWNGDVSIAGANVPEPATATLSLLALAALAARRKRK